MSTTRWLLDVIQDAKRRQDVVDAYRFGIFGAGDDPVNWASVNDAILQRWSPAGLNWIKKQAWKSGPMASPSSGE